MKIRDLWESYHFYTQGLTEHGRKLAFATAAICWFFKSEQVTFPTPVILSLTFVVLYFLLDMLQYFISALVLRSWTYQKEAELEQVKGKADPDDDVEKPPSLDAPAFRLFIAKHIALLMSFIALLVEFALRII